MTAEREALVKARDALQAMMDTWFDYHDAHSLTRPVTGASENAFERALAARDTIDQALANPATIRDTDEDAEAIKRVEKWLDGGCSSWGVPAQDIRALLNRSATPAEPREASGYCPYCMTADPVSRA